MSGGLPLDIEHLLSHSRVEGDRVEYKATFGEPTELQVAKTVCAFANDLDGDDGGYVIIGVASEAGVAVRPVAGLADDQIERIQQRIRVACGWISPDYQPRVSVHVVDGRRVVALRCFAGDLRPYDVPSRPGKDAPRAPFVRIGPETVKAEGQVLVDLLERSRKTPFDARRHLDARPSDLAPGLVASHLQQAGSGLVDLVPTPDERLRRMDLLVRVNGHEVPRNAALLFFAHDVSRWFPHARIEAVVYPDGKGGDRFEERVFTGPLPDQLRACLSWLRGATPTMVTKSPDRPEASRVEAWPFAAVEEALTNAIVHRGYDTPPEPIIVEVLPDALVILSYPGPVHGVRAADLDTGEVRRVPPRNRRVGELLKEIGLCELRATGVQKIRRAMERNGSPPPRFTFDEVRTFFEVRLPIHPALARGGVVPLPLRPGQPCPPDELVGRSALIDALHHRLLDRRVTSWLVGPRGRGKSSVLEAVARRAAAGLVDLAGVTDPLAAASAIDRAMEAHGRVVVDHALPALLVNLSTTGPLLAAAETVPDTASAEQVVWAEPPDPAAARVLVDRLLAGTRCPPERRDEVRAAVTDRTGVNPAVPHLLLHTIDRRGTWTPEAVEVAWTDLLLDPRDPAGLAARSHAVAGLPEASLALLSRLRADPRATLLADDDRAALLPLLAAGIVAPVEGRLQVEL